MYKVARQEVKTIYDITITLDDMMEIAEKAAELRDGPLFKDSDRFPALLNEFDLIECGPMTAETMFRKIWSIGGGPENTKAISFIVEYVLKFDGIVNYGFYREEKMSATLEVYKYGDQINR